jgi:adenine deaminase
MLVFHGPTVHRELQLWVEAGVPPVALQAATWNAAKLLRADNRIGLVAIGRDANLLVVDGDPTRDIAATERISLVVLKGAHPPERVVRPQQKPASMRFRHVSEVSDTCRRCVGGVSERVRTPSSRLRRPLRAS